MWKGPDAPRLDDYLSHMLDAVRTAIEYVGAASEGEFLVDRKTQQAVIYNLMVLGEAATRMATEHPSFVAEHRQIPWQVMRGMRNRMAHGYFRTDMSIVWRTVRQSLPPLEGALTALVSARTVDRS